MLLTFRCFFSSKIFFNLSLNKEQRIIYEIYRKKKLKENNIYIRIKDFFFLQDNFIKTKERYKNSGQDVHRGKQQKLKTQPTGYDK